MNFPILSNKKSITSTPKLIFSPLSLLLLAACGGGGGTGSGIGSSSFSANLRDGFGMKGPLQNAKAFLDYNNDGFHTAGEPVTYTNENGYFEFELSDHEQYDIANVVITTIEGTVDGSGDAVLSGIKLSAPASAEVVSVATSLMVEGDMTVDEVAQVLGLEDIEDIQSFNPYADGQNAELAKKFEAVSHEVATIVKTLSSVGEEAGLSAEEASAVSIAGFANAIKEKVDAADESTPATIKLSDTTDVTDLQTIVVKFKEAAQKHADNTGIVLDTNVIDQAKNEESLKKVSEFNAKVQEELAKETASLDGADIKALLSTSDQVVKTVRTVTTKLAANEIFDVKTELDKLDLETATKNLGPQAISLSGTTNHSISVEENTTILRIGEITSKDLGIEGQPSNDTVTYSLDTESQKHFRIVEDDGKFYLEFKTSPDFEKVAEYTVSIIATDQHGKASSQKVEINVTDSNEAPQLTVPAVKTLVEDAESFSITGNLSSSDPEKDLLTYSVVGETPQNGFYTVTGTYGTLTLNAITGAYTYALDNGSTTVTELGANDNKTESFPVQVTDGTNTPSVQTLSFVIQGSNDAPSAPALDNNSIDENIAGDTVGTLSSTDPEGDNVHYEIASDGDGGFFEIDGTTLKLKDGIKADHEAKGSYKVSVIADDGSAETIATYNIDVTDVGPAVTLWLSRDAATFIEDGLDAERDVQIVSDKISGFYDGINGANAVLSKLDTETATDQDAITVSNQGIFITTDGGYTLALEFTNFSPSSLNQLQTMFEGANDINDINLSGGFKKIQITDPNGSTLLQLSHSSGGITWKNPNADAGMVDTFLLKGSFENQIKDYIDLIKNVDAVANDEQLQSSFVSLIEELNSLIQLEGISASSDEKTVFDFTAKDDGTLSLTLMGTGGDHVLEFGVGLDGIEKIGNDLINLAGGEDAFFNMLFEDQLPNNIQQYLSDISNLDEIELTLGYDFAGKELINISVTDFSRIEDLETDLFILKDLLVEDTSSNGVQITTLTNPTDEVEVNLVGFDTDEVTQAINTVAAYDPNDFGLLLDELFIPGSDVESVAAIPVTSNVVNGGASSHVSTENVDIFSINIHEPDDLNSYVSDIV